MKKRGSKKAKQQSAWNKVKTKCSPWVKSRPKTTILLIVIGVGLLWYGLVVFADFVQFKMAERRVDTLYSETIKNLGEPDTKTLEGSCGYASAKFHKGDLGCGYGFSLVYKATDLDKANELANTFAALMENQKSFKITFKSQESPVDLSKLYFGRSEVSYQQKETTFRLSCTARVMNVGEGETYLPRGVNDRVRIDFSCGKSPLKQPIYPVKD